MPVPRLSAIFAVIAITTGGANATSAPIWVTNPGPSVEVAMPLRLGVPFPKGLVAPGTAFDVRIGTERHAAQTSPLERWPDGSIRWMLTDVVLPAVPAGRSTLLLEEATSAPGVAPRIDVNGAPSIRLRSARLSIDVAPTGDVAVRRLGTAAPDIVVRPIPIDAGRAGPATVTAVRVVSRGPLRAEVVIEQEHPGGVTSDTHVVAWADSTTILLRHRVVNRGMTPTASLRSVPVTIRIAKIDRARVLLDGTPVDLDGPLPEARLTQTAPTEVASTGTQTGTHLDGAITVGTGLLALTAVVPDFWQQYPKAFAVSGDALTVDLVAGGSSPVDLGVGAAKSHDLWLHVERAAATTDLATLAQVFQNPPRAVAAPKWAHASGAAPGLIDAAGPAAKAFLGHLRSDALRYDSRGRHERWDEGPPGPCSARATANPRTGFFGVLHWGDWNFPGYRDEGKECDAWGNLEYDLPLVFGLAWASTGDPIWAGWFERAVAHYRDVDVIHALPQHPDWVGLNHPHKVGHFDLRARAKVDLGHVWLGGLLLHHRLTGDDRSRDAMAAMAQRLPELMSRTRTPRQFGWPIIALAAAADATGAPPLRDAAVQYARLAMARFPPDHTASDWKIGILASGLASVHRATGDDGIRDWLVRYGAGLLADEHRQELDPRYVAVSGYLAVLTRDPHYAALANAVASEMPIGTWGKPLAMYGRTGFELLTDTVATDTP